MEENTVEMFDYLRVIWKRKILIIVMTLVCIGVGGAVVVVIDSSPKPPVTYHADAVLKIGKKVKLVPTSGISSSVVEYIENPGTLAETIPLLYASEVNVASGYHLDVQKVGSLGMIKLILKGPDKGLARILKKLVDLLIDEHRRKAKDSVESYKDFMRETEAAAEMLKKDMSAIANSIKQMKRKEGEYLVSIESAATVEKGDRTGGDRSAFLNMLYLKTIDRERDLNNSRTALRNIQWQLSSHQITLGNLEEYKTEMVGEITSAAIKTVEMKKSTKETIMLAGIAGLIMSTLIAFFKEYLEESKSKRNENGKVDLA